MARKNKLFNKWIKWGIVPCLLLFFWMGATVWYMALFDSSFLVLSYPHSKDNFLEFTDRKLLQGNKVSGEFQAEEDNLGIVSVRFATFARVPYKTEDRLLFKIKELGAKQWYYQNAYRSGLIYEVPVFPFGFPKIDKSKGKVYHFEIESLRGNKGNAVAIQNREPILFSKYQADKQALLQDNMALVFFGIKKLANSFQLIDFIFVTFVFLLPLLFYLFLVSPVGILLGNRFNRSLEMLLPFQKRVKGAWISYWHFLLLAIVMLLICLDIFFLQLTYDLVFIVLLAVWVFVSHHGEQGSKLSYLIGGISLFSTPIILLLNNMHIAELVAAWGFIFFVVAIGQSLFETRKSH